MKEMERILEGTTEKIQEAICNMLLIKSKNPYEKEFTGFSNNWVINILLDFDFLNTFNRLLLTF